MGTTAVHYSVTCRLVLDHPVEETRRSGHCAVITQAGATTIDGQGNVRQRFAEELYFVQSGAQWSSKSVLRYFRVQRSRQLSVDQLRNSAWHHDRLDNENDPSARLAHFPSTRRSCGEPLKHFQYIWKIQWTTTRHVFPTG